MLTPVDLENRDFRKAFRGYDIRDVDEYLERLTAEFERIYRTNGQQRDEIDSLKARIEEYRGIEANLRDTLMMAQDASQHYKANAAKESELVLHEAKDKARRIVEDAEDRIKSKLSHIEDLRKMEELFRIQFKSLLESYITAMERSVSVLTLGDKNGHQGHPGSMAEEMATLTTAINAMKQAAATSDVVGSEPLFEG